jgi:hypothetical protein
VDGFWVGREVLRVLARESLILSPLTAYSRRGRQFWRYLSSQRRRRVSARWRR